MAVSKEKKNEILDKLKSELKDVKSLVCAQYSGLSVTELTQLRRILRKENVSLIVAKKTLIKLAAKESGLKDLPDEAFEGSIAIAISKDDVIAPAKEIFNFAKKHKQVKITGGIVDDEVLDAIAMNALATIPSKEELYAKLVGSMQAPIYGFYNCLRGVMDAFVRTLNAVAEKQA